MHEITVNTFVQGFAALFFAVLTALAPFIVQAVLKRFKLEGNVALGTTLENAMTMGIQRAQAGVANMNIENPKVQSAIIADTTNYVIAHIPDTLKAFGIDVTTEAGRKELADKAAARLAPAIMVAVASPRDVSVATAATIVNPAIPTGVPPAPATQAPGAASPTAAVVAQTVGDLTAGAAPPSGNPPA